MPLQGFKADFSVQMTYSYAIKLNRVRLGLSHARVQLGDTYYIPIVNTQQTKLGTRSILWYVWVSDCVIGIEANVRDFLSISIDRSTKIDDFYQTRTSVRFCVYIRLHLLRCNPMHAFYSVHRVLLSVPLQTEERMTIIQSIFTRHSCTGRYC